MSDEKTEKGGWTFFTNHSHILFYLHFHPDLTMREIALKVGITERAVQRIIKDLHDQGILEIEKCGRCNRYQISRDIPLRHPIESHRNVGELLDFIGTRRQ